MGYVARNVTSRAAKKAAAETVMLWTCGSVELPTGSYRTLYKNTIDVTDIDLIVYTVNVSGAVDFMVRIKLDVTAVHTQTNGNGDRHFVEVDVSAYTGEKTLLIEGQGNGSITSVFDIAFWCREV